MRAKKKTGQAIGKELNTSRSQLDRFLDPQNITVSLGHSFLVSSDGSFLESHTKIGSWPPLPCFDGGGCLHAGMPDIEVGQSLKAHDFVRVLR